MVRGRPRAAASARRRWAGPGGARGRASRPGVDGSRSARSTTTRAATAPASTACRCSARSTPLADHPEAAVVACVANSARACAPAWSWPGGCSCPRSGGRRLCIRPRASRRALSLGLATVLLAGCVLTTPLRLGRIRPGHAARRCSLTTTRSTTASRSRGRATLAGGCPGRAASAYIGQGAMIRENVAIGPRAVVGMGAVVLRDVPAGQTWVGSPAPELARRAEYSLATRRTGT